MAITGISSYDGKQIIAAGAQSATKAYQDSNGDVITSKYQTTANMSNYQTTAGMSDYATVASVTGKQDALTFGYTDSQISQINGSAIYSQGGGGGGYTGNVQQALDEVYSSSATWNTVTNKLDAASQVVTATGGTTSYIQTINGKNISASNAGSALSATNAYNLTNTAIKVASATSASTAYTLGNTAIKVASATSATNANTATYASNGVSLTNIYNSARSGYAASAYLTANVTGNTANWQRSYSNMVPHIFQGIQYTAFDTTWGYGNSPVASPWIMTARDGGNNVKIRLNYGKMMPHCSAVTGKVAVYPVDRQFNGTDAQANGIPWYRVDIDVKGRGYYGAQWTYYAGAVELSGCWSPIGLASNLFCEWLPPTQIEVVHNDDYNTGAYVNVLDLIHRDIDTAVGDNNKWHLNASFLIIGYGN
jgi:hypothetical protein